MSNTENKAAPLPLTDIDAVAFAAASGHVAAARLMGMLGGTEFDEFWFDRGDQHEHAPEAGHREIVDAVVNDLAGYVCRRSASGEQLWIKAADFDLGPSTPWAGLPVETRIVWHLFAQTCLLVHRQLAEAQARIAASQAAEHAAPAPLTLQDSIFDPGPSMGDLVDGWAEEQKRVAAAEAEAKAQKRKTKTRGGRKRSGPSASKMTVGETMPAKPVNKGGRGRRKPAPKTAT